MSRYERMVERYAAGEVPWDDELPPPEVTALVDEMAPGKALDLGCGYGRAAIYLAQHGWQVDGVDFVPQALEEAERRARETAVSTQLRFYCAPVSDLDFLTGPYDLTLDVGCMHSLDEKELRAYAGHVRRLLRPGGVYLLFARLREATADPEEGPRGVPEELIRGLFAAGFELISFDGGETAVPEQPPWRSGWFRFRRTPLPQTDD